MTALAPVTLLGRRGEPATDATRSFLQLTPVAMRWIDVSATFLAGDEAPSA